jgi:hypothetical protein
LASLRPFQGRARRRLTVRSRSAFAGARADQAFRPKPRARSIAPTSCSSAALPSRPWTHKAQTTAATRQRGASPKAQQVRTTANDADAAMAAAYAGNLEPLRARSTVSFIGARAPPDGGAGSTWAIRRLASHPRGEVHGRAPYEATQGVRRTSVLARKSGRRSGGGSGRCHPRDLIARRLASALRPPGKALRKSGYEIHQLRHRGGARRLGLPTSGA